MRATLVELKYGSKMEKPPEPGDCQYSYTDSKCKFTHRDLLLRRTGSQMV